MPNQQQAADVRGPRGGTAQNTAPKLPQLAVINLSGSSQSIDLTGANYFNGDHYLGKILNLVCASRVYYFWSADSTNTVTETAADGTTKAQQCDELPPDFVKPEAPGGRYLHVKGTASAKLRITIAENTEK